MGYIFNQNDGVVNVRVATQHYCGNVIRKMTFGKRFFGAGREDGGPGVEEEEHVNGLFIILRFLYSFCVSDYVPLLRGRVDLDGHEGIMRWAIESVTKYQDPEVDERIRQWNEGTKMEQEDLLDVLIMLKDKEGCPELPRSNAELRNRYLSRLSANNPSDNRASPMANTSQFSDLKCLHREIHGMAEQMRIMNENNARLVQLLAAANPPHSAAPPIPDIKRSHHSNRSGVLAIGGEEMGRGRSPRRGDRIRARGKSTSQKIRDLDSRLDAINTGTNALFKLPTQLRIYEGKTDLMDHLNSYKSLMSLQGSSDEVMCKPFSTTLKGSARSWFRKLPPGTIDSFGDLNRLFIANFMSYKKRQKNDSHLFTVHQKETESLKDFVKRFNQTVLEVEDPSDKVSKANKYIAAEELAEAKRRQRGKDDHKRKEPDTRGYLRKYVATCPPPNSPEKRYRDNRPTAGDIQTIHGGFGSSGCSTSYRKRHARSAHRPAEEEIYNLSSSFVGDHPPITFNNDNLRGLHLPHDDALVVSAVIANFNVQRILVDSGSSADILFISALVNKIYKEQIGKTMEVYIDDMLVKSLQAADHIAYLEEAFGILWQHQMMLNPSKCIFGVSSGIFLGFLVTKRGIEANPDQIQALVAMSLPRNVRELKKYLGSPPLLTVPTTGKDLYVYLSISPTVVSVVLILKEDRVQRLVYYVSKVLMGAEARYSKIEKLAYALMIAARKLCHYFQAHPIIVLTDQPLKQILQRPDTLGRLLKGSIELSKFHIEYKPRMAIKVQALADFIIESTHEGTPELEITPSKIETLKEQSLEKDLACWILFVDSSSNQYGCGVGLVIQTPTGEQIEYAIRIGFKATNNEAEYEALLASLRVAVELGAQSLDIFSDSKLVVNQV
ncbi:hypothetical protein Acr_28g0007080 [Actinidia rufa]|uniref:RNase H type-1 domain-containing protein n=1 Tax=Actinidia rufa TaxID=165716 RepID=A0A7J0HA57_9ERIC|nr:hypothetical protein Acr_28g0007080 [Actinidia rufa]